MAEETQTTPAASSTSPAPKQGKNATTIIIIVIVVLVVLGVGGYFVSRYIARMVGEKAAETLIDGATGGKVDVSGSKVTYSGEGGSLEISETNKWPTDLPGDIPQFTYGTVKMTSKTTSEGKGSWSITLEAVQSGAYDKYLSDLKTAGWEEATTSTGGGVNYADLTKGGYELIFTYEESAKTASLLVTPKSE